jgi:transcriptional regulator with XRE-family HTH domain
VSRARISAADRLIGANIKARRLVMGRPQEALAKALGITFQQVQKYETGTNRVAASRLIDIARALEVPVEQLLTLPDLPEGDEVRVASDLAEDVIVPPPAPALEGEILKLMRDYRAIANPGHRRQVRGLARALASGASPLAAVPAP